MLYGATDSKRVSGAYLWHLTKVGKSTRLSSERVASKGVRCPKHICENTLKCIRNIWICLWKEPETIMKFSPKPHTHTQNHLCILLILKRACVLFSEWGGGVGDVAWPFNFPWHFTKTWKAEVLFNLTYASDQLIKGVSWRTVNQNCARVVLKLRQYAA